MCFGNRSCGKCEIERKKAREKERESNAERKREVPPAYIKNNERPSERRTIKSF